MGGGLGGRSGWVRSPEVVGLRGGGGSRGGGGLGGGLRGWWGSRGGGGRGWVVRH